MPYGATVHLLQDLLHRGTRSKRFPLTCCIYSPDKPAMTQAFYFPIAVLPTKQRLFQGLPYTLRKASSTLHAAISMTGRACIPRLEVSCESYQGQHAHVQGAGPDISNLDPPLQHQWDHAANAHLGTIVIQPKSARKVIWCCDQCPDGHLHSWSAVVRHRSNGTGCPQCSGRQVCTHNSLATKAPLVAAQWDYQENNGTPDDVVAQSNRRAKWHCEVCGCKWEATPNARVAKQKAGCPQCADVMKTKRKIKHPTFAECQHPLLAEWDHDRNAAQKYFPDKVRLRSGKKIAWLCTKCPAGHKHSWSAAPNRRTGRAKTGCPFCAGQAACRCNSLQALYPDKAAEWDYRNNQGRPSDYSASSSHLAWWSTPQRGCWQQSIHSRTHQVQQQAAWLKRRQERQVSADRLAA